MINTRQYDAFCFTNIVTEDAYRKVALFSKTIRGKKAVNEYLFDNSPSSKIVLVMSDSTNLIELDVLGSSLLKNNARAVDLYATQTLPDGWESLLKRYRRIYNNGEGIA